MQIGREKEYRQKKKHAKRGEKQTWLKKTTKILLQIISVEH